MEHYKLLGVDKNANKNTIKKKYMELAKKYHPDRDGGDENMFKKVTEAYEILSDPKKREVYDNTGQINMVNLNSFGGFGDFSNFDNFMNMPFNNMPNNGSSVSTEIRTTIVNGKQKTIKKTTIRYQNGVVNEIVEQF